MSSSVNYAHAFGIESAIPAAIFAALYVPLIGWFILQSIRRPTYVHFVLTFFCGIRIAAFIVRAILAGVESVGENLSVLIADQVLFGVGFFGLLYSAYTLVLDRELLTNYQPPANILSRLSGNRRLFRLVLLGAVILGVVGSTQASSSNPQGGKTFRIASTFIFLALTLLLAYRTLLLTNEERSAKQYTSIGSIRNLGKNHGGYILCFIALLLIVREAFTTATSWDAKAQNTEHFWYPFYATPELLALILYASPDLVPARSELSQHSASAVPAELPQYSAPQYSPEPQIPQYPSNSRAPQYPSHQQYSQY